MPNVTDLDLKADALAGENTEQKTVLWVQNLRNTSLKSTAGGEARSSGTFERMDRNLRFYNSDQWERSMPRHRAQIVDNRCFANVEAVLPIVTDNRPRAEITAKEEEDKQVVDMLADAYYSKWDDLDLQMKGEQAMKSALVLSEGYWKVYWDPTAANGYGDLRIDVVSPKNIFFDPNARDYLLKDAHYVGYHAAVRLSGLKARYPDMAMKLEAKWMINNLSPEVRDSFTSESLGGVTVTDDASGTGTRWVNAKGGMLDGSEKMELTEVWVDDMTIEELTPDYIVTFDGDTKPQEHSPEIEQQMIEQGIDFDIVGAKDLTKLGYEDGTRHRRKYPNGRIITIAGDILLRDKPSPYKHGRSPYVRFFRYPVPDRGYFYGEIDQIIPLQMELNKRKSQIIDIMNITANPPMLINIASGIKAAKMTNEPGLIIPTNMDVDRAAKWLQVPNIPSALFVQIDQISQDIDTVSGVHDITQGRRPTGITAAAAIETLQEAAQTRIRLAARYYEYSLKHAAELMLSIIWDYYRNNRTIRKKTEGGYEYKTVNFSNAELAGGIPDVVIKSGSTMPISEAIRRQDAKELRQMQVIDDKSVLDVYNWPDKEEVLARVQAEKEKQMQAEMQAAQAQAQGQAQ